MKQKKLSLKQQKNMVNARSHRSTAYDQIVEALLVAHRGKTLECSYNNTLIQIHNSRTFDLVVGDRIILGLSEDKDPELLEHIPPKNVLYRIARDRQKKLLAANIDLACVVLAIQPEPWEQIVAQYYTHLRNLSIPCCFVVNKCDQNSPPQWLIERLNYFRDELDVPYVQTSVYTGTGITQLHDYLNNKTSIIIGPSGVGKSSLIQLLLKDQSIRIGELSSSFKGQHTTSVGQLYFFDTVTRLIDSPGIRQLAMEEVSVPEILQGFDDFQRAGCKFRDCDHIDSKGCLVLRAIESGSIPSHRYEDYLYLRKKFLTS